MITVNQNKDIFIKDVSKASFVLKYKSGNTTHSIDLNPADFQIGGSLSTGQFFTDMGIYTLDKVNKILSSVGARQLSFTGLKESRSESDITSLSSGLIEFEGIETSKEFEVLGGVPKDLFWLYMFIPKINKSEKGRNGNLNITRFSHINLNAYVLVDLMYRIFLYSSSQKVRDSLTTFACKMFSDRFYDEGLAFAKCNNAVLIFDKYINDYVQIGAPEFKTKLIYPLSYGNNSVSSLGEECVSYLDSFQLFKSKFNNSDRNHLEVASDTCILTTTRVTSFNRVTPSKDTNENNKNIFNISGYKALGGSDDYLIGATLYADYKVEGTLSNRMCTIFNEPRRRLVHDVAVIFNSNNVTKLSYDDIVFDKGINEIISNSNVKLGMSYTGYTKSGGNRLYDYDTLRDKKISPTSRRDLLNDIVLTILRNAGIEKVPFFKKLDVDFKRFYGFIKK